MTDRRAPTDHPIHPLLAERWSPCGFSSRPVAKADLLSLFEAARWAPSCYNEQPWSYIVATRHQPEEFQRLLSCLVEANRAWAMAAPVLALGVVTRKFKRNNKDNRAAAHDLGLASACLVVEAMERGLFVHQMLGMLPEKARELYQIPADSDALTALAIGYRDDSPDLPDAIRQRDQSPRQRKPLSQFVFGGKWGTASGILG